MSHLADFHLDEEDLVSSEEPCDLIVSQDMDELSMEIEKERCV